MKKNILMVFGIGDTFCDINSPRCIKRGKTGPDLAKHIEKIVKSDKHDYDGYVFIHEPQDTISTINVLGDIEPSKVVDVKLCSSSVFDMNNQIMITDIIEGAVVLDGNQFDHVLRPEDYNLFVAGIDINGVFNTFVKEASVLGYSVTIYSDIIKPFSKDTINNIITAVKDRNKDVVFRKS